VKSLQCFSSVVFFSKNLRNLKEFLSIHPCQTDLPYLKRNVREIEHVLRCLQRFEMTFLLRKLGDLAF